MNFFPYSPFVIPKEKGLIANDKQSLSDFWSMVDSAEEGLSNAIGVYIFGIRAAKGVVPWYVGKAEKQGFIKECFQHHKLTHYDRSIVNRRGTPTLTLIPKLTAADYFAKSNGGHQADISTLEQMLIGTCLRRNPDLMNARDTKLYKEMVVPGYLNSPKGRNPKNVVDFKKLLGI
jgi:hypothetical protein